MHVRLIAPFILAAVALGALRAPAWSQERRPTKEEREKRKAELRELQKTVRREVKQIDFEKTLAAIPTLVAREKVYMALVKTLVDTATGGQGDVKKLLLQGRTLKLATLGDLNLHLKLHRGKFVDIEEAQVRRRLSETLLDGVKYDEEWLVNILDDFEAAVQVNVEVDARVYKFDVLTYDFPKMTADTFLRSAADLLEFKYVVRGDTVYVYKEMYEVLFDETWLKEKRAAWAELQKQKAKEAGEAPRKPEPAPSEEAPPTEKPKDGLPPADGLGYYAGGLWLQAPVPASRMAATARDLLERQKVLYKDLNTIGQARKDILYLRKVREDGTLFITPAEEKLEKRARKDLHIFMERFRNNTLEVLDIYDRVLGKTRADVYERAFGKTADEIVGVELDDVGAEEVADFLWQSYGVRVLVDPEVSRMRSMSLEGELSLRAVLQQVETSLRVKLVQDGKRFVFEVDPNASDEYEVE